MKKPNIRWLTLLLCAVVVSFLHTTITYANVGSVSVAPGLITASISEAAPEREETILVKNNFSQPVKLAAVPYGVDKQTGRVSTTEKPDKSLEGVITLSQTEFTLEPNQSINLKVLIKNSDKLAPGGHYAAIVIKQVGNAGANVGIEQAVSVTMYIIKEDGAIRSMEVDLAELPRVVFATPSEVTVTFQNTGNVILVPRAAVSISDGANVISKGVVNDSSLPVTPGNNITLKSALSSVKSSWLPSRQILAVQYRADGQDEVQTIEQTYWYVPWQSVVSLVVVLAITYWQRKRLVSTVKKLPKNLVRKKPKSDSKKTKKLVLINDIKPNAKTTTKKS